MLYAVYCILYTVYCILYTVYRTLYTVHCTLYAVAVHCILYTVSVYCILCSTIEAHYQYSRGYAVKMRHIISKYEGKFVPHHFYCTPSILLIIALMVLHTLECTDNVSQFYYTPSIVLKCASILLHTLDCTDNAPRLYCTPSIVLIMCLDCTAHPQFYCT